MFKKYLVCCLVFILPISLTTNSYADIVIEDSGVEVSKQELEQAVKYWSPRDRENASVNDGDRYNVLSRFMVAKKINEAMKKVTVESDPELYWKREFAVRNVQNNLYFKHFNENIKVPDMTELAKEKLLVNKELYASSPEERKASHMLIACAAGPECDREAKRPVVEKLLSELRAGASFEEMVEKYSDDPGSKKRKGVLNDWYRLGQTRVDPYFIEGLYSIKKVGDYSDVTETQFGFHIIRLDGIKKKSYKADEEVLPDIKADLEKKYKRLSVAAFTSKLILSQDAFIDDKAIDEVLAKYKPKTGGTEKPKGVEIKQFIRK